MIEEIYIRNFKSITQLTMPLGRLNVLIGANGSGKSNILEAIGMIAAKSGDKIELDSLAQRGAGLPGIDFLGVTYGFGFQTADDVDQYPNVGCAGSPGEIGERLGF